MTSAAESPQAEAATSEAATSERPSRQEEADPLTRAEFILRSIDTLAPERHPEAFSTFDELLREALDSPPHVSPG